MTNPERLEEPRACKRTILFQFQRLADLVPARYVLYMLSFTGFVVSFMMRMDMNMVIVQILRKEKDRVVPVCSTSQPDDIVNGSYYNSTERMLANDAMNRDRFDWSTDVEIWIINSFYWCYLLSQVAGGMLTQRFGTKLVFGGSQFATAICSLLIPEAAYIGYVPVVILRSIQGVASGLTWPAMYAAVAHWIPLDERSRFMSSFQGFSFGIGIIYPLAGFIMTHYHWKYVFYTTGSIGVLWSLAWYLFAYDTPSSHPRISPMEYQLIQGSIGEYTNPNLVTVPWKKILKSWPCWSIGLTTFGRIWVHYVFIVNGPKYMENVLGLNIQTNGILNGLPFILSYITSVGFCWVGDVLVRSNTMSLLNVRKLFTALAQVVPGILTIVIGLFGCNVAGALTFWFIAVALITAAYAGAMANVVDIAPNYAGPVLAFAQTIHMCASFISPAVGTYLTKDQSLESYQKYYQLTAVVSCLTYGFFHFKGSADVQSWNYPDEKLPQPAAGQEEAQSPLNDDADAEDQDEEEDEGETVGELPRRAAELNRSRGSQETESRAGRD
ncbi:sialin [Trichogramma pretiosum]|uniref:sialin n=1 Tax=Trichogramma pretiosum TaxID=7493 RepID=UPI0006C9C920|nr:sialin [Trichogramma pretiosum]XP_014234194.1 sialin [Trichogramma pretiosum]XP_014234197.1 sialin [Trichogramma pretiosum]